MLSKDQADQIIEHHVLGYARDDIATMLRVSTGSVSNIIGRWRRRNEIPDVDEIRQFMRMLRKTKLTLKQCSEGFRMFQLMNRFSTEENENIDFDQNNFTTFVEELYDVCIKHQLLPNMIISWFRDLIKILYEYQHRTENSNNSNQLEEDNDYSKLKKSIPLATTISSLIEEMKQEVQVCRKKKRELVKEIDSYVIILDNLNKEISNLKQDKIHFLSMYSTFSIVDKYLKENCNIDLCTELESFANVLNGFKEKGYDLKAIFEKYNITTEIDWVIDQNRKTVNTLQEEISRLQNAKSGNQALLDASRKNWDTFSQLEIMKFGLEELKQLWLIITDIASNRGIDSDDAVSVFIRDVEENYYEKLLFENRVIQKRKELETTNNQLILNRQILSAQPFVGTSMSQLYRNGITEHDIVELVHLFQNSFLRNERDKKLRTEDYSNEISKNNGWKALAEDLKKYDGIKEAVRRETINLNKLRDKYLVLIKDMKDLSYLYQTAFHLINLLNNSYSYFKGYFDQCQDKNIFNFMPSNILVPLIILVSHPSKNDKEEERD